MKKTTLNRNFTTGLIMTVLALSGCSEDIAPPVADAGDDQSGLPVGAHAALDGSESSDPDGRPLEYTWRIIRSPVGSDAKVDGKGKVAPHFLLDRTGDYELELTVSNGFRSASDTVVISAGTCGTNLPVVDSLTLNPSASDIGVPVRLSAEVSHADMEAPCDGSRVLSYAWSLTKLPEGSQARINEPSGLEPSFTPDLEGSYEVMLVVTDELGRSSVAATQTVSVGVCGSQAPVIEEVQSSTTAPGIDQAVQLSAQVSDPDAASACGMTPGVSYEWTLVGMPEGSQARFNAPHAANPSFVADMPGEYVAQLVAIDDTGLRSAPETITITASVCGGNAPSVTAVNPSNTAPHIGELVSLSGPATDADNDEGCELNQSLSYAWEIISAPGGSKAELNGSSLSSPSFVPDVAGEYEIALLVTDSAGDASTRTSVIVTASECGGNSPVVASIDPSSSDPAIDEIVALSAAVTDSDTDAACGMVETFTYEWAIVSAPAGSLAQLNGRALTSPSFRPDVAGEYTVGLVVTDSSGNVSARSTATISASACGDNLPVVASINLSTSSAVIDQLVALSATVTDSDTEVSCGLSEEFTYDWAILSAPAGSLARLNGNNLSAPSFRPDVSGTYEIGLVVADSSGNVSARSTTTVSASTCGEAHPTALIAGVEPDAVSAGPAIVAPVVAVDATIQVTGDSSSDADNGVGCNAGQGLFYSWRFTSLPAGSNATLNNAQIQNPSFVADEAGQYSLELVVTDSTGRSSSAATYSVVADPAVGIIVPAGFSISTVSAARAFNNPRGLTKDASGNIYVADEGADALFRISSGGTFSTMAAGGLFSQPHDVTYDSVNNQLFVSGNDGNNLIKVALNGSFSSCVSGRDYRGLSFISSGGGNRVVAADISADRLEFINPATCSVATTNDMGGNLDVPWGVAARVISATDSVFVTNEGSDQVWRNTSGSFSTDAGANNRTSQASSINNPRGIATTPCATPKLVVANRGNGNLLLMTNGTNVTPSVIVSNMDAPFGVYFEDANNLLVSDEVRDAIFRITGDFCSL